MDAGEGDIVERSGRHTSNWKKQHAYIVFLYQHCIGSCSLSVFCGTNSNIPIIFLWASNSKLYNFINYISSVRSSVSQSIDLFPSWFFSNCLSCILWNSDTVQLCHIMVSYLVDKPAATFVSMAGRGEQEDSAGPEDSFGGSAVGGEERGGEEERAPAAVHQRQMCLGAGEG